MAGTTGTEPGVRIRDISFPVRQHSAAMQGSRAEDLRALHSADYLHPAVPQAVGPRHTALQPHWCHCVQRAIPVRGAEQAVRCAHRASQVTVAIGEPSLPHRAC